MRSMHARHHTAYIALSGPAELALVYTADLRPPHVHPSHSPKGAHQALNSLDRHEASLAAPINMKTRISRWLAED